MAYVKQNFVDGDVLNASELNHMEDGIGNAYIKPSGGIPGDDIADEAITTTKYANESVTAEKIADNAVSTLYTATIPANGWSGGENTVSVSGLLATDNAVIDVDMSSVDDMSAAQDAFGALLKITVGSGTLTAYAEDAPDIDIPIKILCIRK